MKVIFAESHNLDRPDPLGSHHYIRLFKDAGWNCLWLGPAISPMHIFKPDALNRHRFRVWLKGGREIGGIRWQIPFSALFYYDAPALRSLAVGRNQYRFCLPPVLRQLQKHDFAAADLLWCAGPVALSLLDLIPHRISCYRIADQLDRFSRIPKSVVMLQKELIKRVDFVLATSRSLYEWAANVKGSGVYYLPNGVGDEFPGPERLKPADFPAGEKPVAVYIGTLDTRFDLPALKSAVEEAKELHFLIIGPVTDKRLRPGLEALKAEGNFSIIGAKPYSELPAYLKHCAVGMIPFHLNELTEAVNPIKYYEYLACGLPVVAPAMRELALMQGPINIYRGRKDFSRALREAVAGRDEMQAELCSFAAKQTWRSRFKEVEAIINQLMGGNKSG